MYISIVSEEAHQSCTHHLSLFNS